VRRIIAILPVLALVAAACGTPASTAPVVATTTILGDIATHVAAPCGLDVATLMPVGQDPHGFRPSAAQAATVRNARLVLANGLGLEQGLADLLTAAESDGVDVLRLGDHLDPVRLDAHPSIATPPPEASGMLDPHVWLDPVRMADGVDVLTSALAAAFPDQAACLQEAGATYRKQILATHEEIRTLLAAVPPPRRSLVTNHESLGYFADRYGFVILGVVIPGGSTLAEPSPADLRDLVAAMEKAGVDVVFAETTEPARLAEAVAAEVGHPVEVVELYTGSLGPAGSGADTYLGLLETDAHRIAGALGG